MASPMTEEDKALISIHLAEYARLSGETHATFQRQQQQINIMVVLAVGIVTLLFPDNYVAIKNNYEILTLIPIPFIILAALYVRDDIKLIAIEKHIYTVIRPRIVALTNGKDQEVWQWVKKSHRFNENRFSVLIILLRYVIRYAAPFVPAVVPLMIYIIVFYHIRTEIYLWDIILWLDVIGLIFVFGFGFSAIRQRGRFSDEP